MLQSGSSCRNVGDCIIDPSLDGKLDLLCQLTLRYQRPAETQSSRRCRAPRGRSPRVLATTLTTSGLVLCTRTAAVSDLCNWTTTSNARQHSDYGIESTKPFSCAPAPVQQRAMRHETVVAVVAHYVAGVPYPPLYNASLQCNSTMISSMLVLGCILS